MEKPNIEDKFQTVIFNVVFKNTYIETNKYKYNNCNKQIALVRVSVELPGDENCRKLQSVRVICFDRILSSTSSMLNILHR